jgi:hypothetical protein
MAQRRLSRSDEERERDEVIRLQDRIRDLRTQLEELANAATARDRDD